MLGLLATKERLEVQLSAVEDNVMEAGRALAAEQQRRKEETAELTARIAHLEGQQVSL